MVCSPASSEIATNGMPRQTLAAMIAKRAFQGSPEEVDVVVDEAELGSSTQLMMENCESKIHQKAIADSAVGTIHGSSTTARSRS